MSGSNCLERGRAGFNYCPTSGLLEEEGDLVGCIEPEKWKAHARLGISYIGFGGLRSTLNKMTILDFHWIRKRRDKGYLIIF